MKAKHLEFAAEDHIPIGLHGIDLKPSVDNRIAWSDVGGLTHAKKIIVETLKWPTQVCKLSFFFLFWSKAGYDFTFCYSNVFF